MSWGSIGGLSGGRAVRYRALGVPTPALRCLTVPPTTHKRTPLADHVVGEALNISFLQTLSLQVEIDLGFTNDMTNKNSKPTHHVQLY